MPEWKAITLQQWTNENITDHNIATNKAWLQTRFINNRLCGVLSTDYEDWERNINNIFVVATHQSAGITLPVYKIRLDNKTIFTLLGESDDRWVLSVDSPVDLDTDFMGLFDPEEQISRCNCTRIPAGSLYGSYSESRKQFTVWIRNHYMMYTFFWIYADQVLGNKNKENKGH